MEIASWNVNSIRSRLEHVTTWLKKRQPDVLLLQELKGTEFPTQAFKDLGYASAAVTQKAYNGVAVLFRLPLRTITTTLAGDDVDSHARFLEVVTTSANDLVSGIHDRMPVILEPDSHDLWLDPGFKKVEPLLELLRPYRAEFMKSWQVSTRVNSVMNDDAACIEQCAPDPTSRQADLFPNSL